MNNLTTSFENRFYTEAFGFNERLSHVSSSDLNYRHQKIVEFIHKINQECGFRGLSIRVKSDVHLIDWSHGETGSEEHREAARGTIAGQFIGYGCMPYTNQLTGEIMPSLATVMDTTMHEPDIDHYSQVIIATPICGAEITLLPE